MGFLALALALVGGSSWGGDPRTHKITARVPVGSGPLATREGFGSVWVTNGLGGTVTRIDTAGVGLAADERGVWVSTAVGTVLRLRPDDGRLVATIRILPVSHTSPGAVAIDGNSVWVSNYATDATPGPGAGEPSYGKSVGVVEIDALSDQIVHRVTSAGYPVSGMRPGDGTLYMVGGGSFDVVATNGYLWVPSWNEHSMYVLPQEK